MKIGIVCYPTYGGSGVVATELGIQLAKKGHEVHFITYSQPVRLDFLSSGIHFHQVQVQEYPLFRHQPYELALSSRIVNIVKKCSLEILHVHYAIPHAYAAYMAKKMLEDEGIQIGVVTTLHGTDITLVGSHPVYKTAANFSINKSDVVTAVSHNLKSDTQSLFNIKKDIDVIYNFLDASHFEKDLSSDCQRHAVASKDEMIITHVSNFRPVKRIKDVIKVFDLVQQKIPAKLLLVGEGPDLKLAKNMLRERNIYNKTLFLGNTTELQKILCYSDLFLLPSETESFGLAALESMAAKTAVISSNAGGLPEVNIHGVTGYLSNVGDVEDMAKNAIRILSDKNVLESFKSKAQRHAHNFNAERIIPKYEAVYEKALSIMKDNS